MSGPEALGLVTPSERDVSRALAEARDVLRVATPGSVAHRMASHVVAAHAARAAAEREADGRGRDLAAVARERDALRATLSRVEAATASVSSLPWPLPVPTQAEWDAMPAAEKAVRDAVGQWRRLAVERGAEVERLTVWRDATTDALVAGAESVAAERDAVKARARGAAQTIIAAIGADGPQNIGEAAARIVARLEAAEAERDLYRAALAAAARGEAARCDTHHGGVLATQVHADGVAACDACAMGDGWTDTPHAEAIRGALKTTEGGR